MAAGSAEEAEIVRLIGAELGVDLEARVWRCLLRLLSLGIPPKQLATAVHGILTAKRERAEE